MKLRYLLLSIIFLFIFGMDVNAGLAEEVIKTESDKITLLAAIERISQEYEVYFTFDMTLVSDVEVEYEDLSHSSAEEAVSHILKGTNLKYKFYDRRFVILYKEDEEGLESLRQMSRHLDGLISEGERTITSAPKREIRAVPRLSSRFISKEIQRVAFMVDGKVIDQDGEALIGVNIQVKGSNKGTATDFDGNFILEDIDENAVLVISYVGYQTQEVSIAGKSNLEIVMVSDSQLLDEVVVVGYGTQKKKDLTGAVSMVNTSDLNKVIAPSAQDALQGLASGVDVIKSGAPGAASKIFIRGITSFGNTDPLIIVDGIAQNLNNISSGDIESIQVLKDAGSAAIYGVRGANGVIVITTKKGSSGRPVINYSTNYGMKYPLPGNPYNVMNSQEWMDMFSKAYPSSDLFANGMPDYTFRGPNGAGAAKEGDPRVDPDLYFYQNKNLGDNYIIQPVNKSGEDWFHNLYKKAPFFSQQLSINGGSENSKYYFGLNYMNDQGTFIKSYEKRYSARINSTFNIRDHIRIGENANIIFRDHPPITGSITTPFRMVPLVPLHDIMGNYAGTFGGPDLGAINQAVALQDRNTDKSFNKYWGIIGNVFGEIDFLKNFTVRSSIGYNISNSFAQTFRDSEAENVERHTADNSLSVSSSFGRTMTWTNTINYEKSSQLHRINVLVGSEAISSLSRGLDGGSSRFFTTDFNYLTLGNGTLNLTNSSSIGESALFSIFGRMDYVFKDKYILSGTLRRDGSSQFGPDKRYGVFPSASLGWRLSQEEFFKEISWIMDLKLRASYGIMGSQNNVSGDNSFFLFNSGLGTTYYDINGTSNSVVLGFGQSRIGNPLTGWEEDKLANIGFDALLFNGKFELGLEFYKKTISGLLFSEPLPAVIKGDATAPTVNIGNIANEGFDLNLGYKSNFGPDFDYFARLNFTSYKNEVISIPDPGYFYSATGYNIGNIVRNEIGYPASSFYGFKVIGLFNDENEIENAPKQEQAEPGVFRFEDINGDGVIDQDDKTYLGDPNPDFTFGLNLGVEFKNFDLSGSFYGSVGNDAFQSLKAYTHFLQAFKEQKSADLVNAWTPENKNTNIPKIIANNSFSTNTNSSSFFVEDASFLKLRSLNFGYTLSSGIIERLGVSTLRISMNANNVFTITKYSGIDPEIGGNASAFGIDAGRYPTNEFQFLFGVNVSF